MSSFQSNELASFAAAALAFYAFVYRNRRKPYLEPETTSNAPPQTSAKELGAATGFVGLPNRCLLTGGSDSEIKKQLTSLGFLIHHHVEGHYHCDKIVATPDALFTSLRQLQLPEATCSMILTLSVDPKTRYVAIRHLLALVIFSNLDVHAVDSLSLLPPTLKELYRSRVKASKEEPDSLAGTALLSWHRITAFILHENPQMGTPLLPPSSVDSQVKVLISLLQEFLIHFVRIDSGHSIEDQQAGLAGVFSQCVKFGYEVFSHPSDWEFTYRAEEQGIVVVPGLKQYSSNTGELHDAPRIVLTPAIMAIKRTSLT
ncbi:hypothetical protein HG530_008164 [Fusarium avenaceum]|nr:hypothetical protein HG530_008164 [Fusarium avenaceum]